MATYTNKNGTNDADTLTYNKAGTYYAYSGKDTIKITDGSGVIVHAGAGNNVISVTGGSGHTVKSAYTEAEGETIASADKLTIGGADMVEAILGSGRDEIILNTTNGRKSDGSLSKIKGGSWTDTFTVNSGAQKYQLYGEAGDDIFNIKGGSNMVFWGGAANDTFNITGGTSNKIYGGDSADTFNISASGQNVILGYGNDTVNVTAGNNQQIKGNLGINTINLNAGSGHVITADIDQAASKKAGKDVGYGVDKLYIDGAGSVTANLGDGKDFVQMKGNNHKIYTEGWGDTIEVYGSSNSTIDAGAGDDIVKLYDKCSDLTIELGDGDDTINVNNPELYLHKAELSGVTITGGAGDDIITIKAKCNYSSIDGGSGNDKINLAAMFPDATNPNIKYSSSGNKLSAETIVCSYSNYTLVSGGSVDNDFNLQNMEYAVVNSAAGDDKIIVGYKTSNSFIQAGTSKASFLYSDKDEVTVSTADKNMIFTGANNDKVTISGTSAKNLIFTGSGNDTIILDGSSNKPSGNTIYAGDGNDTIRTTNFLTGNSNCLNNTVYGGAGNDTFIIGEENADYKTQNLFIGGAGKDTFHVGRNTFIAIDVVTDADTNKDIINIIGHVASDLSVSKYEDGLIRISKYGSSSIMIRGTNYEVYCGSPSSDSLGTLWGDYAALSNIASNVGGGIPYSDYGASSCIDVYTLGQSLEQVSAGITDTMLSIASNNK